jgi:hypothetical protein
MLRQLVFSRRKGKRIQDSKSPWFEKAVQPLKHK